MSPGAPAIPMPPIVSLPILIGSPPGTPMVWLIARSPGRGAADLGALHEFGAGDAIGARGIGLAEACIDGVRRGPVVLVEQADLPAGIDDGDGDAEAALAAVLDRSLRHLIAPPPATIRVARRPPVRMRPTRAWRWLRARRDISAITTWTIPPSLFAVDDAKGVVRCCKTRTNCVRNQRPNATMARWRTEAGTASVRTISACRRSPGKGSSSMLSFLMSAAKSGP